MPGGIMKIKTILGLLFLAFVLGSAGCARFRPKKLDAQSVILQQKDNVFVGAKKLSEQECRQLLDRRIIKRGYQPIHLVVHNQSEYHYALDASRIRLALEDKKAVAKKMHRKTGLKMLKVAAITMLICAPLAAFLGTLLVHSVIAAGCVAARCGAPPLHAGTVTVGTVVTWPLYVIPPIFTSSIEGISSATVNKKISRYINQHAIDNNTHIIVKPGEVINRLMFVKIKNMQTNFSLPLENSSTEAPLNFEITL